MYGSDNNCNGGTNPLIVYDGAPTFPYSVDVYPASPSTLGPLHISFPDINHISISTSTAMNGDSEFVYAQSGENFLVSPSRDGSTGDYWPADGSSQDFGVIVTGLSTGWGYPYGWGPAGSNGGIPAVMNGWFSYLSLTPLGSGIHDADFILRDGTLYPVTFQVDASGDMEFFASGPPPAQPAVHWYVPDGSTTTPDFPVWETNATNLSTSTIYRLDVVYSFSGGGGNGGGSWGDSYDDWFLAGTTAEWFSSHFAYTATPWGFFSTSTWAGNGPNKGISLITPFYSPPYSWSATAYLYATTTVAANLGVDNPGAAIASSTVNFSINPGTPTATDTYPGVVQPYPSSTAGCGTSTPLFETTGSPPYFQINDPIPVIQVGVCKAMGSLFQMTPAQSTDINDRLVAIQNSVALKPPFAFFNELGNTIGYFAVGTTTYSSYNPVNGTIGGELVIPTTTFVLMDASSTAGFSPLFTPIDDGLAVLIYVISLTWLLKRIRYVEL
jgi:hypothetical protein